MGQQALQRSWHAVEVERFHEQPRILDLAPTAGAHESPQLLFHGAAELGGLLLQDAERAQVAVGLHDPLHPRCAEGSNQLVFEVEHAHEETERLHPRSVQARPEPGPLETTDEVALLPRVAEAGEFEVEAGGTEQAEELGDRLRASDRNDGDAFGGQIAAPPCREHLGRYPIAVTLDQHNTPQMVGGGKGELAGGHQRRVRTASSTLDDRRQEPPRVIVHASSCANDRG